MVKYIHYFIDKRENLNNFRKKCLDTWKKDVGERIAKKTNCELQGP